jgi:putative transcriptional regulator
VGRPKVTTAIQLRHVDDAPKEPLHYTACGLDDVYLLSGYEIEQTPYGNGVSIKNVDELHKVIGIFLISTKKLLHGKEIRFLRHQMDLTQAELARLFGCDSQMVARYEKDENKIAGPSDRLLRLLYLEHLKKTISVRELLSEVDEMDEPAVTRMVFERVNSGWKNTA